MTQRSGLYAVTAEEYAQGLIRRAVDAACVPDMAEIADKSALSRADVERIRDQMYSGKRRPVALQPSRPAEDWHDAKDHPNPRIRALHARAEEAINQVERAVSMERNREHLKAREAALLKELDELRRQAAGPICCEVCFREFTRTQALSLHRTRSHPAVAGE
jgi:hypothetical protein